MVYRTEDKPPKEKIVLEFPRRWWDSTPKVILAYRSWSKKYTFRYTRRWRFECTQHMKCTTLYYTTKGGWIYYIPCENFCAYDEKSLEVVRSEVKKSYLREEYSKFLDNLIEEKIYPLEKEIVEL